MRSKSEVSKYFKQYLADHHFSGTPSPVETVRTDDATEFKSSGKAASSQVKRMFSGMGIPLGNFLWAAQAFWACHALIFPATRANPM